MNGLKLKQIVTFILHAENAKENGDMKFMISWERRQWLKQKDKCECRFNGKVMSGVIVSLCSKSKNVCCFKLCPNVER